MGEISPSAYGGIIMATFTNMATLSFNGSQVNSNTVTGTITQVLSASKASVEGTYYPGDTVTFIVSITNSGTTAFTDLTITDDLGGYTYNGSTVYPLTYVEGSAKLYVGSEAQAAPTVSAGPPMVISGLSIPASSGAVLIYQARAGSYAPLGLEEYITNTITVTGTGISDLTASATTNFDTQPRLAISKCLSPTVVAENGQITYTFTLQNYGPTAVTGDGNAVITDTFDPALDITSVTFNGTGWTAGTQYTYDASTGVFATQEGYVTVPAATYTQTANGTWTTDPGVSTLIVVGNI